MSHYLQDSASYKFLRVVSDAKLSREPVAEFVDREGKTLRFNLASLETTIKNEVANAERYPEGNARGNLVHLHAARDAFVQLAR